MQKINNRYSTPDLKLSTFLLSSGILLSSVSKDDPKKIVFNFENDDSIPKLIEAYWNDEAVVNPKQLFQCWDYLKKLIHGDFII